MLWVDRKSVAPVICKHSNIKRKYRESEPSGVKNLLPVNCFQAIFHIRKTCTAFFDNVDPSKQKIAPRTKSLKSLCSKSLIDLSGALFSLLLLGFLEPFPRREKMVIQDILSQARLSRVCTGMGDLNIIPTILLKNLSLFFTVHFFSTLK